MMGPGMVRNWSDRLAQRMIDGRNSGKLRVAVPYRMPYEPLRLKERSKLSADVQQIGQSIDLPIVHDAEGRR